MLKTSPTPKIHFLLGFRPLYFRKHVQIGKKKRDKKKIGQKALQQICTYKCNYWYSSDLRCIPWHKPFSNSNSASWNVPHIYFQNVSQLASVDTMPKKMFIKTFSKDSARIRDTSDEAETRTQCRPWHAQSTVWVIRWHSQPFDLQRSAKVTWLKFAQHFVAHPVELERQKWHQTTRRNLILLLH